MNAPIISTGTFLIQRAIHGDRKKQKELYAIYSAKMFKICVRYTRNETEAEDVFQTGFINLFNSLDTFNGEQRFEVWIQQVFVNTAIDHLKHNTSIKMEGPIHITKDKQKEALENLTDKELTSTANTLSVAYRAVGNLYAIRGFHNQKATLENTKGHLYIA